MNRLLFLVAMMPVLLAAACGDRNACNQPPPGVGAVVTDTQAASDPGQSENHVFNLVRPGRRTLPAPLRIPRPHWLGYPPNRTALS